MLSDGRMAPVTTRLKALRASASPSFSIRAIAAELGMPAGTYAAYEDPKKFKKAHLPLDLARRLAVVLGKRGIDPGRVLELAGIDSTVSHGSETKQYLKVTGAVAAGVWREQTEWPPEEQYLVEVGPSPVRGAERFAVRMEGYSMDKTIPPGSDLECLRVGAGSDVEPLPGDLVIVERQAHDLVETTCKRLTRNPDGEWILCAESTKAEFQSEIPLGRPDRALFVDNEVRITGVVIKAHQNHFRPR